MSQLFDQDFFRFFLGFVAIICTSLIIILGFRLYEEESAITDKSHTSSVIQSITK